LVLYSTRLEQGWHLFRPGYPSFLLRRRQINTLLAFALLVVGCAGIAALQSGSILFGGGVPFYRGLILGSSLAFLGVMLSVEGLPFPSFCVRSKYFRVVRITSVAWMALTFAAAGIYYKLGNRLPRSPMRLLAAGLLALLLGYIHVLYTDFDGVRSAVTKTLSTVLGE